MTPETMTAALADLSLCWTLGPDGAVLVDGSHTYASPSARNHGTTSQYVALALRKGKTEAELAAALRSKVDGDPVPYDAIVSGPDV